MEAISIDIKQESLAAALGISPDRKVAIETAIRTEMARFDESGEFYNAQIIESWICIATTDAERVYCAYQAGRYCALTP